MGGMATKERVIQLIDSLPDTPETELRLDSVVHELEPNGTDADAKPGDIIDEWGNLSAMKRRSARRKMKRLSEEEIAANGETLAEAWGHEKKNPG
jgi:hypothetical protein